jgi:hypothetical protein
LAVEVSNISKHGFWLLIGDGEHFLPFEHFPWFKEARVGHLLNVELQSARHLYWPDLDIDLSVESIHCPGDFPVVAKTHVAAPVQRKRARRKISGR